MKTSLKLFSMLLLLALVAAALKAKADSFTLISSMNVARVGHTTTLLTNGQVLVVAGDGGNGRTELYDPATGIWTDTGSFYGAGLDITHTANLLPNGQVLIVGEQDIYNNFSSTWWYSHVAVIYSPITKTWSGIGGTIGGNPAGRKCHTATLLPNGQVLSAGGEKNFSLANNGISNDAELYDPSSGTWTPANSLNTARELHTATLLTNGQVLVAGGTAGSGYTAFSSAELYDSAVGTWMFTGSLNTNRSHHTATLLPNGQVLVVGGEDNNGNPLNSAELYDPTTGIWVLTGSLHTRRYNHTATLLPNNQVLVAGGQTSPINNALVSAEIYDMSTGIWTPTCSLNAARYLHTATLLPSGKVLFAGGGGNTAEIFESGPPIYLIKAVKPAFSGLTMGTNYQLQISPDLASWTNHGSPFSTTNSNMIYPEYWDVDDWNKLFFRLLSVP